MLNLWLLRRDAIADQNMAMQRGNRHNAQAGRAVGSLKDSMPMIMPKKVGTPMNSNFQNQCIWMPFVIGYGLLLLLYREFFCRLNEAPFDVLYPEIHVE